MTRRLLRAMAQWRVKHPVQQPRLGLVSWRDSPYAPLIEAAIEPDSQVELFEHSEAE